MIGEIHMREKMMFSKAVRVSTLLCMLVLLAMNGVWAASNDLFQHTVLKGEQLGTAASMLTEKPVVIKASFVRGRLDLSCFTGRVNLNLFPGVNIAMKKIKLEQRGPADYSWFGQGEDAGSRAIIVVKGKRMAGTVHDGRKLYKILPLGDNLFAVHRLDPRTFPMDHPPQYREMEKKAPFISQAGISQTGDVSMASADGVTVITVLVAYTRLAQLRAGDIGILAQVAVDETNTSYEESDINIRLELVFVYQTDYRQSPFLLLDRDRFQIDGDGYMDEVHGYRDMYGADVCVLIVGTGSACGIASDIMAEEDTAFAVVKYSCATGYYSFGHEIGHLQGARHNLAEDDSTEPFPYGHGFCYKPGLWRTIMSYDCGGDEYSERQQFWSNPNKEYNGVPTGSEEHEYNARVLNETSSVIASFRQSSTAKEKK